VYEATLRNHPHDARGMLSYLRGGRGAYGYLAHASVEDALSRNSCRQPTTAFCACGVPSAKGHRQGGLTIYGAECGRYPICPTVIMNGKR